MLIHTHLHSGTLTSDAVPLVVALALAHVGPAKRNLGPLRHEAGKALHARRRRVHVCVCTCVCETVTQEVTETSRNQRLGGLKGRRAGRVWARGTLGQVGRRAGGVRAGHIPMGHGQTPPVPALRQRWVRHPRRGEAIAPLGPTVQLEGNSGQAGVWRASSPSGKPHLVMILRVHP